MAIINIDKKLSLQQRGQLITSVSKTLELLGKGKHRYRKMFLKSKAFKMYFDSKKFNLSFVTEDDKEYEIWLYNVKHSKTVLNLFKEHVSVNILNNDLNSKNHKQLMSDISLVINKGK